MIRYILLFISAYLCGIMAATTSQDVENVDTMYYQPAEVVAYNDTSVYFGTTDNNIFYIEANYIEYPDTVPYLLHMDSMGTDDISDDEIIVVWRCVK